MLNIKDDLIAGVILLAVCAALLFYGKYEHAARLDAQHQLAQVQAVNQHNAAVEKLRQQQYEAAVQVGADYAKGYAQRNDELARIKKELSNANQRPVSPAVGRVLGELLAQ